MAFKLSKIQEADLAKYAKELDPAVLSTAIDAYNDVVAEAFSKLQAVLTTYNQQRDAAHDYLDSIITDLEAEWEDKSEAWQGSDKGEAVQIWLDSLKETLDSLDQEATIEFPDAPSYEGEDLKVLIDDIPTEP